MKAFNRQRGSIVLSAVLAAATPGCTERADMDADRLPSGVVLLGTTTSPSGYRVAADVAERERDGKSWPFLTITISGPEGTPLYQSEPYAAWFDVRICWDPSDRLWIASNDTGTDVLASTRDGWARHRWSPDAGAESLLDATSGERIPVVRWEPPAAIRRFLDGAGG